MDGNNEYTLQFEWTSPLGAQPNTFYCLKGVVAEQAMVCMHAVPMHEVCSCIECSAEVHLVQACVTYAAALESKAYALAQAIAETDVEALQATSEQHAAAAALFRQAAGVYKYAGTEYMHQLTSANQSDR